MKPKTPVQKPSGDGQGSKEAKPIVPFNSTATVHQKLAVITNKFQGFAQTLVEEKTKKLNSTERKINSLRKAVEQLLKLVEILKQARHQQIHACESMLNETLNKWQLENNKKYHPKLNELSGELQALLEKLNNMEQESKLKYQKMLQFLQTKMQMASNRFYRFIQQYNKQKKLEFDEHNQLLDELRNMDHFNFDLFQSQIQDRENALTGLREKVNVFKPQRVDMEEQLRVEIDKQLICVYKTINSEDVKRKATSDELFEQINHYTKRIKSCIGNM